MPVMPFCCGSPDCGCARSVVLSSHDLTATTDPVTLDGSHTASMPALSDFASLSLTVTNPGCYLKSVSLGTASVSGGGGGSFNLYLLVWWTTGELNVAVVELATGATWDNLAIVFYNQTDLIGCCAFGDSGNSQTTITNQLPDMGAVNDTLTIDFPAAIVSAGLFTSTSTSFVIAGDTYSTMDLKILCYRQARRCADDSLADVWMTSDDAENFDGSAFTLPGDSTCYYFNFDDDAPATHGTLYTSADAFTCGDCTACENPVFACAGRAVNQPAVTVSGGTGTWNNNGCTDSCDFSGTYAYEPDSLFNQTTCALLVWAFRCAATHSSVALYYHVSADTWSVALIRSGALTPCGSGYRSEFNSGNGWAATSFPSGTFSCVDGVLTGTVSFTYGSTQAPCTGTVTLVFG